MTTKILKKITEKETSKRDNAVSPVIGEMLLIALVLILIPGVTITLMQQLPQDRIPTVNILMYTDISGNVVLSHKGGDYINLDDIEIFVRDEKIESSWKGGYQKVLFDLGNEINVPAASSGGINPGDKISLVAKKAVIFRGVVPS
jgi:FlaG/FlaF family flagellin (archaellin)